MNEFVDISDSPPSALNPMPAEGGNGSITAPRLACESVQGPRRHLLLMSAEAFGKDLSAMLAEHSGEWVAFVGPTRVGYAKTRIALIRDCMSQGLHPGEFLIRRVEPQPEEIPDLPRL